MTTFHHRIADALVEYIVHEYGDCGCGHHKSLPSHDVFFSVLFKALAPYERKIKSMLASIWDEERRIIIANLKKLKGFRKDPENLVDSVMYPKSRFVNKLSKEAKKILALLMSEEGQRVIADLGLGLLFDMSNPNVTTWLEEYTPVFSENLERVSVTRLRAELIAGMGEGETIPQLMARVNNTYRSWNEYRAEIIARTETSRAANRAALEGYKQSGVVTKKVWMCAPGCCDFCASLDGVVVGIEENFQDKGSELEVDGQTMRFDYEDVATPPAHVSCRCSIAAEF